MEIIRNGYKYISPVEMYLCSKKKKYRFEAQKNGAGTERYKHFASSWLGFEHAALSLTKVPSLATLELIWNRNVTRETLWSIRHLEQMSISNIVLAAILPVFREDGECSVIQLNEIFEIGSIDSTSVDGHCGFL